ncbi:hypothetical protein B0H10DRAFT_1959943 [Mycena sp. CBHHK59/15]|nr:hypothetical protein B0H10DRAFT_1959943 [Mycena sp. CBHHK59/15]
MIMFRPSRSLFAHAARCIQAAAIPRLPQRATTSTWSPTQSGAGGSFIRGDIRTWHRPSFPLPKYWSCDWPNWDNAEEYNHGHMSTEIMKEVWGVAGEVEPLAFVPEEVGPESVFVFFADGVYYWHTYGQLRRFEGPFADHDDFLRRLDDKEIWGGGIVVKPVCGYF